MYYLSSANQRTKGTDCTRFRAEDVRELVRVLILLFIHDTLSRLPLYNLRYQGPQNAFSPPSLGFLSIGAEVQLEVRPFGMLVEYAPVAQRERRVSCLCCLTARFSVNNPLHTLLHPLALIS